MSLGVNKIFVYLLIGAFAVPGAVFAIDTDGDGLTDDWEAVYMTDANNADTDGDGYPDGVEVDNGYSPHAASSTRMHEHDYDGDGINDWLEIWFGSSLSASDTDGDGHDDRNEVMRGFDPADATGEQKFEREIIVDRSHQRLAYMVDGVKIENYPVSTGNPGTQTPEGEFEIQRKIEKKDYRGADYFVEDVWWNMQFIPMYYIHAAYWHNDFGRRTHSHGCVNMTHDDAKDLYQFVDEGMKVTVTGTTPAGFTVGS